jgi:hypothetical protein
MSTITVERFTLKTEHIKLLRRACVSWDNCEFGAPGIDCKRPYGNGDVLNDIAEILELPKANESTGEFPFEQESLMHNLHKETKKALQVILSAKSFTPGIYESPQYMDQWKMIQSHATRATT